MSATGLDLFQVYGGIGISTTDLTSGISILQGIGSPAGADADAASAGSTWSDTTANQTDKLNFWWKWNTGTGLDKWTQAAPTEYVQAAAAGLTWRVPVLNINTAITATANLPVVILPATTPVVDGVAIPDHGRVLFAGLIDGSGPNVYIWNGTAWVNDTKAEADGDAVFAQEGPHAEQEWIFDGVAWFQFGGSTNQEIANVRAFIGKDAAGTTYPSYVSHDIVTVSNDLRLGVSQLDDSIGLLQFVNQFVISNFVPGTIQLPGNGVSTSSITDITAALNALDSAFGNGTVTNTANYFPLTSSLEWAAGGTLTLTAALNELNNAIGNRTYTSNILTTAQTITNSLEAIDQIIGDLNNSSAYTAGGLLSAAAISGNSVQQTFNAVNVELGIIVSENFISTGVAPVSTLTPLEPVGSQLLTSEATQIEWLVQIKDASGKRQGFTVHALTDGTTVDYTQYSIAKTGGNIGGTIGFDINIVSGKIVPSINPAAGAGNLTFTIKRLGYSYLA